MAKKKPKSYSSEHTPSFTELCKPHAIESLIVTAMSQVCTISDYEFIYLTWSHDSKMAACMVTPSEDEKHSQNGEEIHCSPLKLFSRFQQHCLRQHSGTAQWVYRWTELQSYNGWLARLQELLGRLQELLALWGPSFLLKVIFPSITLKHTPVSVLSGCLAQNCSQR